MSAEGGTKAVVAALSANLGIAVVKFVAFGLTGFSSLLAEAIHSVADSGNQVLLLVGRRQSRRKATPEHPFGYGQERFLASFLVALVLFSVGGLFALYEAWHKVQEVHGGHTDDVSGWRQYVPVVILGVSVVLEGLSFRTAMGETRKSGGTNLFAYVRRAKQPELPVVLLEDSAALLGLTFALVGVVLSLVTGNDYFDAAGTGLIGLLLVGVAIVLGIETKSLLIGEAASIEAQERIAAALVTPAAVESIIHLRTLHLGPEELLVAAKIAVPSAATAQEVASAIDEAEAAVRAAEPTAHVIYLEPDIRRG